MSQPIIYFRPIGCACFVMHDVFGSGENNDSQGIPIVNLLKCGLQPFFTLVTIVQPKIPGHRNYDSFSQSVFYPFGNLSAIFIKLEIVVCRLFEFWKSLNCVVWERVMNMDITVKMSIWVQVVVIGGNCYQNLE